MRSHFSAAGRLLAALLALLALLTGCARTEQPSEPTAGVNTPARTTLPPKAAVPEKHDGVFTLNYHPDYSLNPYTCQSEVNRLLCSLLFEPLVAVTPNFEAEPVLCTGWESADGLVFTFTLREALTFSDGTALSCWDVMYSLNRAMESGSVYAERLRCIHSVAQDNGRVVITLRERNYSFPLRLEIPIVKEGSAYLDLPLGTGPYVFTQGEDHDYLRACETWQTQAALPLERIYLEDYPMEEVSAAFDAAFLDLAVTEGGSGATFHTGIPTDRYGASTSMMYFLGVNAGREALADPARRRLVASAVDRQAVAAVVGGDAAALPMSPASAYYDAALAAPWLPADLDAYGVEILTEDYDGDGYREYLAAGEQRDLLLDLVVCEDNPVSLEAARKVQEALEAAGVQLRLRPLDRAGFNTALAKRDYDLYFAAIRLPADFDLSSLLCPGGSAYLGSGEALAALAEAFRAAEEPMRMEAARSLLSGVAEACPLIPLAFGRRTVLTRRGTVSGLKPSWTNPFYHITDWQLALS